MYLLMAEQKIEQFNVSTNHQSFYELKPESLISNFFIARFVRVCISALYSASDSSLFIAI